MYFQADHERTVGVRAVRIKFDTRSLHSPKNNIKVESRPKSLKALHFLDDLLPTSLSNVSFYKIELILFDLIIVVNFIIITMTNVTNHLNNTEKTQKASVNNFKQHQKKRFNGYKNSLFPLKFSVVSYICHTFFNGFCSPTTIHPSSRLGTLSSAPRRARRSPKIASCSDPPRLLRSRPWRKIMEFLGKIMANLWETLGL